MSDNKNNDLQIFLFTLNGQKIYCRSSKPVTIENIYDKIAKYTGIAESKIKITDQFGKVLNTYNAFDELIESLIQREIYIPINPMANTNIAKRIIKFDVEIIADKIVPMRNISVNQSTEPSHQMFVKYGCKTCAFQVNDDTLIIDLKHMIYTKLDIHPDMQRLIFDGRQLAENYTLKYYEIQRDSTIHIVARLRGGMFCDITSGEIDYINQYINQSNFKYNIDFDE